MTRAEIEARHLELEREGRFNDEPFGEDWTMSLPVTKRYPYIRRNPIRKLDIAWKRALIINPFIKKNTKALGVEVKGKEHLAGLKSAIVTTNHVHILDCIAVKHALLPKRTKYVVAEFNVMKGTLGRMMQAEGILPLSKDRQVMRKFDEAVGYYLNKGQFVAICPEQAMWEMYDKPRPFKIGAFHYAVKYDVPVLPIFITFRPSGTYDAEGNEIKHFTVNIMPPLYANKELNPKEQAKDLMKRNYQACVDKYEEVYGKKLVYETKEN